MNPLIHQHHARRALGICNKLRPGPTKARHNARILRKFVDLNPAAKNASAAESVEYFGWTINDMIQRCGKEWQEAMRLWPHQKS